MLYSDYLSLVDAILTSENPAAPYDQADYFNYTKLNESRMKRWTKNARLDSDLVHALTSISTKQHWIIITEPWCGDAAHSVPFLVKMAEQSPFISYELQLRDTAPFLIDSYLTNGGKSIPKLIVRNEQGEDVFVWGPRPASAQVIMDQLKEKEADFETVKLELQNWYNTDKGASIQQEFKQILSL